MQQQAIIGDANGIAVRRQGRANNDGGTPAGGFFLRRAGIERLRCNTPGHRFQPLVPDQNCVFYQRQRQSGQQPPRGTNAQGARGNVLAEDGQTKRAKHGGDG